MTKIQNRQNMAKNPVSDCNIFVIGFYNFDKVCNLSIVIWDLRNSGIQEIKEGFIYQKNFLIPYTQYQIFNKNRRKFKMQHSLLKIRNKIQNNSLKFCNFDAITDISAASDITTSQ